MTDKDEAIKLFEIKEMFTGKSIRGRTKFEHMTVVFCNVRIIELGFGTALLSKIMRKTMGLE